ncbi:MAG: carbohydrate ABC transporter permease [Ruminiclostridium sp.]|nr:carbohydrate ABC transporter permease [Ruminiclostridium sp.]
MMKENNGKKYVGSRRGSILIFIVLSVIGLFMLFPIYLSLIQSVKPSEELFIFPPKLYAMAPTDRNYIDLINIVSNMWVPFSRYVFNSVLVSAVVTVSQLVFSSTAAYALAKIDFPGRRLLNRVIEITLLFTSTVLYLMQYMVMSALGIIDTYLALILPYIATPMGLFLMRQFISQLPDELIESARIDGAGHLRICWQIVMPNVKPAWLTLMIFAFNGAWQINGGAFIYSESLKPIPTVLQQIGASGIQRAGVAAAATVVLMLPPMVMFLLCQSSVVETMAQSGLKD